MGRPNDSTHTTIRGVDACFLHASSHHSMRSDSRGCFAGHIRFGDVEFRLASCWPLTKPSGTHCQVKLGGLSGWSWLAVLGRPSPSRLNSDLWLPCCQTPLVAFVLSTSLWPITLRDGGGVRPESQSSGCWFRFLLNLDSQAAGIPIGFVFQHRPGDHRDFSSHRDRCFLLACLLATANTIVGRSRPGVVLQTNPGTFQQHPP